MERAEELMLRKTDVKVSSMINSNYKAFSDLTALYIEDCDTVEYLATISCDEIQHGRELWTSFSYLTSLYIHGCSAMKYLFCNSVAKCFVQLQELSIDECPLMEAIILNEDTRDGGILHFSELKSLKLIDVPRLTSFYGENKDMCSNSTSEMDNSAVPSFQFQPLFDRMVCFAYSILFKCF